MTANDRTAHPANYCSRTRFHEALRVAAGGPDGCRDLELQPAGKRRMTADGVPARPAVASRATVSARRRHEVDRRRTFVGHATTPAAWRLQVLLDCRQHDGFVQDILDRHLDGTSTSRRRPPAGHAAASTASCAVAARCDALLRPLREPRRRTRSKPWLWDTLYLGSVPARPAQRRFPAHAAIHETVELAARFGRPAAKGFLNGVLRQLATLVTDERTDHAGGRCAAAGARRVSPPVPTCASRSGGASGRILAAGFALPVWLVRRWLPRYGCEECQRLGFWFAGPAPLTLRCNPLRIDARPTAGGAARSRPSPPRRANIRRRSVCTKPARSATCPATTKAGSPCRTSRPCASPRLWHPSRESPSSICAPLPAARRRTWPN